MTDDPGIPMGHLLRRPVSRLGEPNLRCTQCDSDDLYFKRHSAKVKVSSFVAMFTPKPATTAIGDGITITCGNCGHKISYIKHIEEFS